MISLTDKAKVLNQLACDYRQVEEEVSNALREVLLAQERLRHALNKKRLIERMSIELCERL